jgi:syntaxin 7
MRFADASGGGAGSAGAGPSRRDEGSGSQSKHQQLASVVFQLTTHVNSFQRLVDTLGTAKDTYALRERLSASREAVQTLAREASTGLKELHAEALEDPQAGGASAYHAKLVKDFHLVLKEFQRAQRTCLDREAMYSPHDEPSPKKNMFGIPSGNAPASKGRFSEEDSLEGEPLLERGGGGGGGGFGGQSRMETLELQGEVEWNNAVIQDRQQGIEEIHEQIVEVNEIFQDLAVLVNDQGAMLDDIESNMVRTSTKTRDAIKELKQADKSQRSSRNRMCCLMFFFLTVLAILIVVLIKT